MSQVFPKGWPARYRNKVAVYPNIWQAGPVSSTLGDLGCCCNSLGNTTQNSQLGDISGLGALGACPGGPTVVVEDASIPPWVWLIAAVWGGLMLLKKGGR